jgi:hypothetical protein
MGTVFGFSRLRAPSGAWDVATSQWEELPPGESAFLAEKQQDDDGEGGDGEYQQEAGLVDHQALCGAVVTPRTVHALRELDPSQVESWFLGCWAALSVDLTEPRCLLRAEWALARVLWCLTQCFPVSFAWLGTREQLHSFDDECLLTLSHASARECLLSVYAEAVFADVCPCEGQDLVGLVCSRCESSLAALVARGEGSALGSDGLLACLWDDSPVSGRDQFGRDLLASLNGLQWTAVCAWASLRTVYLLGVLLGSVVLRDWSSNMFVALRKQFLLVWTEGRL